MKTKIPTIEEMLKAGVHFGHQASRWNPKMRSFIFDRRNRVHIFDLEQTQKRLEKALDFLSLKAKTGNKILFIGTKPQAKTIVKKVAEETGMPYVVERWLGGTFTNFKTISKRIDYLKKLELEKEKGEFEKYTKKEASILNNKIKRLNFVLGGLKDLNKFPAAVFVVDVVKEKNVIAEARKKNIPIVAFLDTNADPDLVDYPIPANDDALKSLELIMQVVGKAIKEVAPKSEQKSDSRLRGNDNKVDKNQEKEDKVDKESVKEVMEDLETGI